MHMNGMLARHDGVEVGRESRVLCFATGSADMVGLNGVTKAGAWVGRWFCGEDAELEAGMLAVEITHSSPCEAAVCKAPKEDCCTASRGPRVSAFMAVQSSEYDPVSARLDDKR